MEKTILIIEDDTFILETIGNKFKENHFKICLARNAEEAEKLLATTKPDIILLDLILPKVDGFEILKKIKADLKLKSIPVVIFSNLDSTKDMDKAMELGAVEYLVKANLFPEEVVKKIETILLK